MSYTERNTNPRQRVVTGGVVAVMQVGLALALINGFAVTFFPKEPDKPLEGHIFPTKPIEPDPLPPPETKVRPQPETSIETATKRVVPTTDDTQVVVRDPVPTTGTSDKAEDPFIPTILSSDPPARFSPKGAVPRGEQARWVTTDDYPPADVRANHVGSVRFRLAIDTSGKVTGCTVISSSGYQSLDAATCRNVTRRARFDPARDASGDKVSGSYEGTIRWVIPRD